MQVPPFEAVLMKTRSDAGVFFGYVTVTGTFTGTEAARTDWQRVRSGFLVRRQTGEKCEALLCSISDGGSPF